jgi:HlyD family secretion protein
MNISKPFYTKPIFFIAVAIAIILGLALRSSFKGPESVPRAADVSKAQRIETAVNSELKRTIPEGALVAGNGIVEPADREVKLAGLRSGRVSKVLVKEGEFVSPGKLLVELENDSEMALLEAAKADLAQAKAERDRTIKGLRSEDVEAVIAETSAARAREELSEGVFKRTQLLATSGAATADELDRSKRQAAIDAQNAVAAESRKKAALKGSRAEDIVIAQAKLNAAIAREKQANAQFQATEIRALQEGEVLQIKVRPGENYSPTSAEPLVIMGDTRTLKIRLDIDERDISKIAMGAVATITADAFPGRNFTGKVTEIGKRMGRKNIRTDDPVERIDTKILEVVISLDSHEGLVPGQRVTGYIGH